MRRAGIAVATFASTLVLAVVGAGSSGAAGGALWDRIDAPLPETRGGAEAGIDVERYSAFGLDHAAIRALLAGAPREGSAAAESDPLVLSIPAPGGNLQRFEVFESPVVDRTLQRRYPNIRTYAGRGLDEPTSSIRFDLTPLGFHASVTSERGAWYVDPYYHLDRSAYVSYFKRNAESQQPPLIEPEPVEGPSATASKDAAAGGGVVTRREYVLVLANDPEYEDHFHPAAGTDQATITAAKTTLINRVNQVYNDDLAIKLTLSAESEEMNFDSQLAYNTAGYLPGDSCSPILLNQNQIATDARVLDTAYDVGHIVLGGDGGGIAGLGVVGKTGQKARGCTGVTPPIGDVFAIDYVAHELGHQFDGNHTFNGVNNNCSGANREDTTSVEPGSGSSVMAYAGICGVDNLQNNSDPYFSQRSIQEVRAYVDGEIPGEGTATTPGNRAPDVTAPADETIPLQTPFALTGSATDADGDPLVYLWEQNDAATGEAGTALFSNTKANGPLFRIFSTAATITPTVYNSPGHHAATSNPTRVFPDIAQIAAGNTNAATGTCPAGNVECFSEFLPTSVYGGPLNFRLTVRDLVANGGGVAHDDVVLTLDNRAGPFLVTSHGTAGSATGNTPATVTWDPAGTATGAIGATHVKISYSTDGGITYPTVVSAITPNDGSAAVNVPNAATTQGRFKVEAVGNVFFDISDGNLTVSTGAAGPDGDGDGIPDANDNCSGVANAEQGDADGDGQGDACDAATDTDGDGVPDADDQCDSQPGPEPTGCPGGGGGGTGDSDGDTVTDSQDNCPSVPNTDQADADGDAQGNACDADDDNDGVTDAQDNCALTKNPDQANTDGDAFGNACDADDDNDTAPDAQDNCPAVPNPEQSNTDGDAFGDACDPDIDNDGALNEADVCPVLPGNATNGCPDAVRSLSLNYSDKQERFSGRLRPRGGCSAGQAVKVLKVKRGPDKRVGRTRTRRNGSFRLKKDATPGRYYAKVGRRTIADVGNCPRVRSNTIQVNSGAQP